jgi:hypothetical protein
MPADGTQAFTLARQATASNAPELYAEQGALIAPGYREHATKLYADPARTRWVMVVFRPLAEGEVIEGNGMKFHPITWRAA